MSPPVALRDRSFLRRSYSQQYLKYASQEKKRRERQMEQIGRQIREQKRILSRISTDRAFDRMVAQDEFLVQKRSGLDMGKAVASYSSERTLNSP